MHNNFESIKDIFVSHPEFSRLRKRISEEEVIEKFYSVFPDLNLTVIPSRVEKKVLYLKVENSVLKSELKFNESVIVEKINKYFKEDRIKSIRFVA